MQTIGGWILAGILGTLLVMQGLSPYQEPQLDSGIVTFRDTVKGDSIKIKVPGPIRWMHDTVFVDSSGDSLDVDVVQSDTVEVADNTFVAARFYADNIVEPRGFEFDFIGSKPDTILIYKHFYAEPDGLVVKRWLAWTALGASAYLGYKVGN